MMERIIQLYLLTLGFSEDEAAWKPSDGHSFSQSLGLGAANQRRLVGATGETAVLMP